MELLAAILLVSIVSLLIWTAFFISSKNQISATRKLDLQREANYILTELQSQHRQLDCYELVITDKISLHNCEGHPVFNKIISSGLQYESNFEEGIIVIEPRIDDLEMDLTIINPNANTKSNRLKVKTTISRYKAD